MPTAATFSPWKVNGSQVDFAYDVKRYTVGGLLTGVSGDPSTALGDVITATGMPSLGSTVVVQGYTLYLRRIRITPSGAGTASVQLFYDNNFGGQNTVYIIRCYGYEQPYRTNYLPGTRVPIRVDWTDPDNASNHVPEDSIPFVFTRTITEMDVTAIQQGVQPAIDTYALQANKCNADFWRGLPTGYWKITRGGLEVSRYAGFFQYGLTAATKNDEDWSEQGILQNRQTGRYVKVKDSDITALNAAPYSFGLISKMNGVVRVGPYRTTNFTTLFGFS